VKRAWPFLWRIALFLLASFFLFRGFSSFVSLLSGKGSGEAWGKTLPLLFLAFLLTYALFVSYFSLHPKTREGTRRLFLVNGPILLAFGLASSIFLFVKAAQGAFPSWTNGGGSPLYPLDAMILTPLAALYGACLLALGVKNKVGERPLRPHEEPVGRKILHALSYSLYALFALYAQGGLISFFSELKDPVAVSSASLSSYFVFSLFPCSLFFYEFAYLGCPKERQMRTRRELKLILALAVLSLVGGIWAVLSSLSQPAALSLASPSPFPLEKLYPNMPPVGPALFAVALLSAVIAAYFHYLKPEEAKY